VSLKKLGRYELIRVLGKGGRPVRAVRTAVVTESVRFDARARRISVRTASPDAVNSKSQIPTTRRDMGGNGGTARA